MRRQTNLQLKVVLVSVCALLLVAVALTVYYSYELERAADAAASGRAAVISQGIANECEYGLAVHRRSLLAAAVVKVLAQTDVISAIVFDSEGQVMAGAGRFSLAESKRDGLQLAALVNTPMHLPPLQDAVFGSVSRVCIPVAQRIDPTADASSSESSSLAASEACDHRLGFVELTFSNLATAQMVGQARRAALLIASVLVLVVSLLVSAATRNLVRPLHELALGTQQLAAGNLGARVAVTNTDEIGELAGAFNQMAERLQGSRREILDQQHHLEERVAERTVELSAANARLLQEIVERKHSEMEMREAQTKYRALVEQLPAITYIAEFGPEGKWIYVSPQILTLLGFTIEQWQADPALWYRQMHPEDRDRIMGAENLSHETGVQFTAEYRMLARDGSVLWFSDSALVLRDAVGNKSLLHGVMFDITGLKRLEQQFLQSQKVEAVGRLAGGVAHDFNNILTAILGYSELILRRVSPGDPIRANAEQIEKAADRAASLTRQLLAFSRKQVLEPKVFHLNDVIADLEKMLRRLIGEDIQFVSMLGPHLASVKADPAQIEQVIMNLVVNARDAMPDGGTLTLKTANVIMDALDATLLGMEPGHYVMLSVSDTGVGMTDEIKGHLFEPFFTTKPLGKGTGLGLATCFGIVKQSNGHIVVESASGQGSEFRVFLPGLSILDREQDILPGDSFLPGGHERILLVEDEPAIRELASLELRELGYDVQEACDGEEALEIVRRDGLEVDLLVTDVVMPRMGGSDLADALRRRSRNTKVLFTSGYTADTIGRHGVLDDGISFLRKPFNTLTLARKVREVLDD